MAEALQAADIILNLKEKKDELPNLNKNSSTADYDPDKSPPDFQMARNHGIAKKVYLSKEMDNKKEEGRAVCPCCALPLDGEQIPLCATGQSFFHLGAGYALYFKFIKYCTWLLVLIFAIAGLYNIITNIISSDCEAPIDDSQFCVRNYVGIMHIANKRDHKTLLRVQLILHLITTVAIMLFFHYIRYKIRKTSIQADDGTVTPSDFTVKIDGIPQGVTDEDLRNWIKGFETNNETYEIEKITRAYKIQRYLQLFSQKTQLQNHLEKDLKPEDREKSTQKLKTVTEDLKKEKADIQPTHVAFVAYKSAQEAQNFADLFKKGMVRKIVERLTPFLKSKYRIQGSLVGVSRAPEPTDVLWQNLSVSFWSKFKSRIFTNIITFLLIIIGFGIIVLLNWGQLVALDQYGPESSRAQGLSILTSILIFIINTILVYAVRYLCQYERRSTFTGFYSGVATKLTVAQFANTAFTNLIAKLILSSTTSAQTGKPQGLDSINFFGPGGLLQNMWFVFVLNAFLGPIMTYYDIWWFLKKRNQAKAEQTKDIKMTQAEANELFEGPKIDMAGRYAILLKTMLLTCFYAPAMPIALIFTIVGLVLTFWVDKYVFLRRMALPNAMGSELTQSMVELLEWTAFAYSMGNLVFSKTLQDSQFEKSFDTYGLVYATIGISVFHIVFPMEYVNQKIFYIRNLVTEKMPFKVARIENFMTDYDIENPITRTKAMKQYVKLLAEHGNLGENNQSGSSLPKRGTTMKPSPLLPNALVAGLNSQLMANNSTGAENKNPSSEAQNASKQNESPIKNQNQVEDSDDDDDDDDFMSAFVGKAAKGFNTLKDSVTNFNKPTQVVDVKKFDSGLKQGLGQLFLGNPSNVKSEEAPINSQQAGLLGNFLAQTISETQHLQKAGTIGNEADLADAMTDEKINPTKNNFSNFETHNHNLLAQGKTSNNPENNV